MEAYRLPFEDATPDQTESAGAKDAERFGSLWQVYHRRQQLGDFVAKLAPDSLHNYEPPVRKAEPDKKLSTSNRSLEIPTIDEIIQPAVKNMQDDSGILDKQILAHHKTNAANSLLDNAIDNVIGVFFNKDQESLNALVNTSHKLQAEELCGNSLEIDRLRKVEARLIAEDRQALSQKLELRQYADGFLKTSALFLKGRLGLSGALVLYGLDEVKPSDSFNDRAREMAWGALKGACLQTTFEKLAGLNLGVAARGTTFGMGSRAVETGLDSHTIGASCDLNVWFGKVVSGSLNRELIASDIATFATAHGLFGSLNKFSGGRIAGNPLLARVFTGSTFGISTGMAGELERQKGTGQSLDLREVARRGLIQGALDGLAAGPGGVQADPHVRSSLRNIAQEASEPLQTMMSGRLSGDRIASSFLEYAEKGVDNALEQLSPRRPVAEKVQLERLWSAEMFGQLSARLKSYTSVTESFDVPVEGVVGPFKDWSDYRQRALKTEQRQVREYEVEGHRAKIVIPEEYAQQLDEVRALYKKAFCKDSGGVTHEAITERWKAKLALQANPLSGRLLPERLVHFLDELPNRALIDRVYLLDEADPDTLWHRSTYKSDFKTAANASVSGVIQFFCGNDDAHLRSIIHHEWAHLLRFTSPVEGGHWFDVACQLEKNGYFAREYARKDNEENWAVHTGEELMAVDLERFYAIARRAPLRAAVWSKTMLSQISMVSESQRSVSDDKISERVAYLEKEIVPKARRTLMRILKNGDDESRQNATALLQFLAAD